MRVTRERIGGRPFWLADLWQVALDPKSILIGISGLIALEWWGFAELNLVVIVAYAPMAAICLVGLSEWHEWWRRARMPLRNWFGRPVYPIWQAAWLWIDLAPQPYIPFASPAYPILRVINEAIANGLIQAVPGRGAGIKARVLRTELLRLAQMRSAKVPKFLL